MEISFHPSLSDSDYSTYVEEIKSGKILLTGGRVASVEFEKWVRDNNYSNIAGRFGGYDENSECQDYYYFYKRDDNEPDLFSEVKEIVETYVADELLI